MRGFIVVTAETGRSLRRGATPLPAAAVLDCSGGFHAGDRVYVVTRGTDGGQGVIAIGTIRCDRNALVRPATERGNAIVMGGQDTELLWPPGR